MNAKDKSVTAQMRPTMPTDSDSARFMLRNRWGSSKSIDKTDWQWLADRFPGNNPPDALEMALRLAGLWEQYVKDGSPKWSEFRDWLNRNA